MTDTKNNLSQPKVKIPSPPQPYRNLKPKDSPNIYDQNIKPNPFSTFIYYDRKTVHEICNNFPLDLWEGVVEYLSLVEKLDARLISKDLKKIIENDFYWKNLFLEETQLIPLKDKSWLECYLLSNKRKVQERKFLDDYKRSLPPPMPPPPCGIGYHMFQYDPPIAPISEFIQPKISTVKISIMDKTKIEQTVKHILELEFQFSQHEGKSTDFLALSLIRYEKFMNLKSKYPNILLIPTFDIELVWISHLLRPLIYQKDCMKIYGNIIDRETTMFTEKTFYLYHDAADQTSKLWKQTYKTEYGLIDDVMPKYSEIDSTREVKKDTIVGLKDKNMNEKMDPNWKNPFSISLDDLQRDRKWIKNYEQAKYEFHTSIEGTVNEYEKFMGLIAKYPIEQSSEKMYHPSYSIDLFWHSHMALPLNYISFCKEKIGYFIEHKPWPEKIDQEGHKKIKEIWKEEYGYEMK
eukprot:gene1779-548_t